jgi:hypothetical protein
MELYRKKFWNSQILESIFVNEMVLRKWCLQTILMSQSYPKKLGHA